MTSSPILNRWSFPKLVSYRGRSQRGVGKTGERQTDRDIERTNAGLCEGKTARIEIVSEDRFLNCTDEKVEVQSKVVGPGTEAAWIRDDGDAR